MRPFLVFALVFLLAFPMGTGRVEAQVEEDQPGSFSSYEEMRSTLDDLMMKRRISDLLTAFGGADEMSFQDMTAIEAQVRSLFPDEFENAATVIRQDLENGFAQEMVAYWTGEAYIYTRVFFHTRADGTVVAIAMVFNNNADVLLAHF